MYATAREAKPNGQASVVQEGVVWPLGAKTKHEFSEDE